MPGPYSSPTLRQTPRDQVHQALSIRGAGREGSMGQQGEGLGSGDSVLGKPWPSLPLLGP